jgi:hypothetical protein
MIAVASTAMLAGCVTTETVQFRAKAQQQSLMRDGQAALISRGRNSIVLIRPAARQFSPNGRPVYVVAITNLGQTPLDFRIANIEARQIINGQAFTLNVVPYEQLMSEERNRQIAAAILVGTAAGLNAASAARSGYYSSSSTVYGPRGTYQVQTTGFSPTANAIAQSNAAAQNEAMISATVERGQQNMAELERGVMKDNTLLPNEWYGGQLHLQQLANDDSASGRTYTISLLVGSERHEIEIVQSPTR